METVLTGCGAGGGSEDEGAIELFVPGRLCILGEHSDWAGEYSAQNPAVPCGKTLNIHAIPSIQPRLA
jgi:galactokinase